MSEPSVIETAAVPRRSAEITPVLPGFYPDPTICAVGADYYLATSSFEYFPGAPIFHSRDLVTWTQIGNILTDRGQFRRGLSGPSTGIYGGTLRHDGERFWFTTTNVSDFAAGQLVVHAVNPEGPWSAPIHIPEAIGIDPDLCWRDDGTALLTWHDFDFVEGGRGILQAPVDLSTGRLIGRPAAVWQGSGMPAAEGPHLHKIGNYWYQLLAEGGTERGHCVTIARSASPEGPFEPCPWNPILTRRSTTHAVQNVGHADLVRGPDGRWAMVYLGVRPKGSTPGYHVLGRETFLAGVDWIDDWPVVDPSRHDVPGQETGFTDDFRTADLHPRWVVPDGEASSFVRHTGEGVRFVSSGVRDVLCARIRDLAWSAEAEVENAGELRVRVDDRHWFAVRLIDGVVEAIAQIGDVVAQLGTTPARTERVTLRIESTAPHGSPLPHGHAGPDDLVFSVADGDRSVQLGRMDGRYLSTEVAGGFTGRMIGLTAPSPVGIIRRIRYSPTGGETC